MNSFFRMGGLLGAALLFSLTLPAQTFVPLPRSTPEAEGMSSAAIQRFVEALDASPHELHGLLLLRHGRVVAESSWKPYRPELKHTLYSTSKSFTSTAVGLAIGEGRLSLTDKVVSFFPQDLPAEISPHLAAMTLEDLLTMSAGQAPEPTAIIAARDSNWARAFLARPVVHAPGTQFLYNSMATYMAGRILQQVTGMRLLDYLRPRLFAPLGIADADWETDPMGYEVGGWGLRLRTEDMAKLGQLYLQKGVWEGRQLLPEAWVAAATAAQIIQHPEKPQAERAQSDWEQGYGYQFWRSRHGFRADGAYGQYILVLPEQDAVLAINSETSDMQALMNLAWEHLLPAFGPGKLPASKAQASALKQFLGRRRLPLPAASAPGPLEGSLAGKTFHFPPGEARVEALRFAFDKSACRVLLSYRGREFPLAFGRGEWAYGSSARPGPNLLLGARGHFEGLPPAQVAGAFRWADAQTLELTLRYIESAHSEHITLRFDGDKAQLEVAHSNHFGQHPMRAVGRLALGASHPPRLIVRGDDMGYAHAGNEALIRCYTEGIQTSIEVIAPSPWFPEAVKMLAAHPRADVGVHLAVTSEWDNVKWRPLTDCPSLRDADGYFYPMTFPNPNYPGQSLTEQGFDLGELEREFRAQIELALARIPQVSHLSGHMGCTRLSPEAEAMARRLAREYGLDIDPIAMGAAYVGYGGPSRTFEEKKASFLRMLDGLEAGKTYLFVDHPGLDGPELRAISHIGYEQVAMDRQGVSDLFTDAEVKARIEALGVQLMSYRDLRW